MSSELTLDANYLELRQIGPWIAELLNARSDDLLGSIELAVHELAANSVDHAASPDGQLTLRGRIDGTILTVEMIDAGGAFDATAVTTPDPNQPQVGGYGLMILEQLAATVSYERNGDQNHWRTTFELDPT